MRITAWRLPLQDYYPVNPARLELYITYGWRTNLSQHNIAPLFVGEKVFYDFPYFQFSNGQSLSFQSLSNFWVGGGWQETGAHITFIVSHDAGQSWQSQDTLTP